VAVRVGEAVAFLCNFVERGKGSKSFVTNKLK
jgi:hypothetical protein